MKPVDTVIIIVFK